MSVTTTVSLLQSTIASLGQTFAVNWPFQNASDLVVTDTNATTLADRVLTGAGVDYTVNGIIVNGIWTAASVTLNASSINYAIGDKITIQRKNPYTQPTVYADGTKYPAATDNAALDWIVYSIQALNDIVSRCAQVPPTSAVQSPIPAASRPLQLLGFDANGNFTTYTQPSGSVLNPFPSLLSPSSPIFLPGITAHTGGSATEIDGLVITSVTQVIAIAVSISDSWEIWKFRPYQAGDPNVSDGVGCIVPVLNPNNWRWIRVS